MYEYETEHAAVMRSFGAECAVLLRRNGAFPLAAPTNIALYGSGARRTIKGGTGSGEVNSRYFVTAEQGLESAGFTVTTKAWLDAYDKVIAGANKDFIKLLKRRARKHHTTAINESMGAVMPEPEYDIPLEGDGEAAVYVLSRISGEGSDRSPVPGDILLTETEKRDILALNEKFERFMLVLNVGGPVDLSPLGEVKNILLLSQLGVETGSVLADIILGRSYPSGKLATTWTAWEERCTIGEFGDINDTRYLEGVYVGYRYYDSVGWDIMFPFGFGLGYTDFSFEAGDVSVDGEDVKVCARVTNCGASAGKEVLQLYVSAPQGKLVKPFKELAAFAKTDELQPGESQELGLSFSLRDVASYSQEESAWILESGDYILRLGTSVADTRPIAVLRLGGKVVTEKTRPCGGDPGFNDWLPFNKREEDVSSLRVIEVSDAAIKRRTVSYDREEAIEPEVEKLSDEELAYISIGAFAEKKKIASIIGNTGRIVAGSAGETTRAVQDFPVLTMADGPAGLRLSQKYTVDEKGAHPVGGTRPESILQLLPAPAALLLRLASRKKPRGELHYQYATAIPIASALAQSWNLDFACKCGDMIGAEMERFGVHLWLAPALNIHRDIRCGRNFEYFSEDPLISGKFAAALTRGVQKHPGCSVTIKHYAANNQETNRYCNNSLISERALREIYLRGFGICVRESHPHALMTSYNLLNGTHTSERRDIIEDILRCEFGFDGIVMTDWIIRGIMYNKESVHPYPCTDKIAAAGGDLTMPGSRADFDSILKAVRDGTLSRRQLQINASRILRLARKLTEK